MTKRNVIAVEDKSLSTEYKKRYVIVDKDTGEILDTAQGYGYKSAQNAYAAYSYKTKENGVVTSDVVYMTADEEDNYFIAQANEELDDNGKFVQKKIVCRYKDEFLQLEPSQVDYMDVSPTRSIHV